MNKDIKVSAMCVTMNRPQLTDAINDYWGQTHKNSELVIVRQEKLGPLPEEIMGMVCKDSRVKIVTGDDDANLGELRNLAMSECSGDYMMQWDDDDRYHPQRIQKQLAHHLDIVHPENKASFIDNFLLYAPMTASIYWIKRDGWGKPGSILFGSECPFSYPCKVKGEDQDIMKELYQKKLASTAHTGIIYLRQFHGQNTWDFDHFKGLIKGSFSTGMLEAYMNEIREVARMLRVPYGTVIRRADNRRISTI